jgi:hypothetical protein
MTQEDTLFLLLGFTAKEELIHTVCSIHEETLVIITVYSIDQIQNYGLIGE